MAHQNFFSNIFFGEEPPAPNNAASQAKTEVAPPVSAGPADSKTDGAVKTTDSATNTDSFEASGEDSVQK